jgi:hypothetical protein
MPEVIAEIKDGKAVITVKGVKGKRCREITSEIERLGKVLDDQPTREMKEATVANTLKRS